MVELEGGDVGSAHDLVVGVHVAAHAVRARVLHLRWVLVGVVFGTEGEGRKSAVRCRAGGLGAHLNFEEVLWRAIDLFEALLARIWHCLHRCGSLVARALSFLQSVSLSCILRGEASTVIWRIVERSCDRAGLRNKERCDTRKSLNANALSSLRGAGQL